MASTRSRVSLETSDSLFKARETVIAETPASAATVCMVTPPATVSPLPSRVFSPIAVLRLAKLHFPPIPGEVIDNMAGARVPCPSRLRLWTES